MPRRHHTIRRSPRLAWRRIDDQNLVLDVRSRTVFALNDPAWRLFELVEAPRTRKRILAAVEPLRRDDAQAFFAELEDLGLLERIEGPEPVAHDGEIGTIELAEPPRILWREALPDLVAQASPVVPTTGVPGCI